MTVDNYYWIRYFFGLPKMVTLKTIRFYQKIFSPDHGPLKVLYPHGYCRFYPTCSAYAYEAVEKLGVTRGLILGSYRIFRCTPWSKGGHDPVPEK
jgi:putative membrane protein insertion efficiency factor